MPDPMSFDFDAAVSAPFRMQPGLRRLAPGATQLTPLAPGSRHQREKLAVLSAFADQALVARPGFDPGPALAALCRHASTEHPGCWSWDGQGATAQQLGVRVAAGPERWERFDWNVTDHPRLHAHPQRVPHERWSHEPQAQGLPRAWFRSERQTFIPLPECGQSLFTIAVEVRPLAEVIDRPQRAARLAEAVRTMSPAAADDRGLTRVREPLLRWLANP